jgi:hypothetical protein
MEEGASWKRGAFFMLQALLQQRKIGISNWLTI